MVEAGARRKVQDRAHCQRAVRDACQTLRRSVQGERNRAQPLADRVVLSVAPIPQERALRKYGAAQGTLPQVEGDKAKIGS